MLHERAPSATGHNSTNNARNENVLNDNNNLQRSGSKKSGRQASGASAAAAINVDDGAVGTPTGIEAKRPRMEQQQRPVGHQRGGFRRGIRNNNDEDDVEVVEEHQAIQPPPAAAARPTVAAPVAASGNVNQMLKDRGGAVDVDVENEGPDDHAVRNVPAPELQLSGGAVDDSDLTEQEGSGLEVGDGHDEPDDENVVAALPVAAIIDEDIDDDDDNDLEFGSSDEEIFEEEESDGDVDENNPFHEMDDSASGEDDDEEVEDALHGAAPPEGIAAAQLNDELVGLEIDADLRASLLEMDAETRREVLNDIRRNQMQRRAQAMAQAQVAAGPARNAPHAAAGGRRFGAGAGADQQRFEPPRQQPGAPPMPRGGRIDRGRGAPVNDEAVDEDDEALARRLQAEFDEEQRELRAQNERLRRAQQEHHFGAGRGGRGGGGRGHRGRGGGFVIDPRHLAQLDLFGDGGGSDASDDDDFVPEFGGRAAFDPADFDMPRGRQHGGGGGGGGGGRRGGGGRYRGGGAIPFLHPLMIQLQEALAQQQLGINGDVDNMSYEQLLALQERVGHVSRGINQGQIRAATRAVPLSPTKARYETSNDKCCVCLCDFESGEGDGLLIRRCGHVFHSDCIAKWFEDHKTCPICLRSVIDGDGE